MSLSDSADGVATREEIIDCLGLIRVRMKREALFAGEVEGQKDRAVDGDGKTSVTTSKHDGDQDEFRTGTEYTGERSCVLRRSAEENQRMIGKQSRNGRNAE